MKGLLFCVTGFWWWDNRQPETWLSHCTHRPHRADNIVSCVCGSAYRHPPACQEGSVFRQDEHDIQAYLLFIILDLLMQYGAC